MRQYILSILFILLYSISANCQVIDDLNLKKKPKKSVRKKYAKKGPTKSVYKTLKNGLQMRMLRNKPGYKARPGDVAKLNIIVKVGDSTVFDSKTMNNNQPVVQPINHPESIADLMVGFMQMSEGDKAIFRVKASSIFPDPQQRPPFISAGDMMYWIVEMVELKKNTLVLDVQGVANDFIKAIANEEYDKAKALATDGTDKMLDQMKMFSSMVPDSLQGQMDSAREVARNATIAFGETFFNEDVTEVTIKFITSEVPDKEETIVLIKTDEKWLVDLEAEYEN